jgi:TonB family protein
VTETLQLEETAQTHDAPTLIVEWTSRWSEFLTSLGPALGRSESRLAGEAPFGLIPLRIMIPSYLLEALFIFAAIIVPIKIQQLRPYVAPRISSHDVIYYSGDELPRTEDLGGAQSGTTGRAGGEEAHHRTQTIKIARGGSLVPRVVDAPNLKIPASSDAVANLLAVKPNPGPPPSEGFRSQRAAATLPATVVAPATNVTRDYTRNGVQLDAVIAPAPPLTHDSVLRAPNFSETVVPPAPKVANDHILIAPSLAPIVIAPVANSASKSRLTTPSLDTQVVAPAPSVNRDTMRGAPSLAANVIPPAPNTGSRQLSSSPVQMANVAVVPPPVSAPERDSSRTSKLAMPAPSVIAPPPSTDLSQDMRRLASGSAPDPSKSVVPPPQSASGGLLSNLIGKLFGPAEVVPPPPTANSGDTRTGNSAAKLSTNAVPPPAVVGANPASGNPRGLRNGSSATLGSNVIAPPPSAGATGGTGNRALNNATARTLGLPEVVPPPPSLSGPGGGTGPNGGGRGIPGGTLLADNVVPPPPSISGGSNSAGSGTGRKGLGLGAPMEVGSPVAPPANGGSGQNAGAVISSQPGPKVGLPTNSTGSLALSPSGADKPGLGGTGGGTGIGHGDGPGSGMKGEGTGAGKAGAARGSDPNAHSGISPTPGPGGAGNAPSGNPPVPGVSVEGGTTQVTIPSFGSDPAANDPAHPTRNNAKQGQALGVTIVATAGSGGAFEPYKNLLRGEQYTTYLDTSLGSVVMEFSDNAATGHSFTGALTAPVAIRDDLPEGLPRARMVVTCALDASGNLKNIRVLEPGPADMTAKVLAALRAWKFQPAARANQPVEVTAILGFNIDTNDRF